MTPHGSLGVPSVTEQWNWLAVAHHQSSETGSLGSSHKDIVAFPRGHRNRGIDANPALRRESHC